MDHVSSHIPAFSIEKNEGEDEEILDTPSQPVKGIFVFNSFKTVIK